MKGDFMKATGLKIGDKVIVSIFEGALTFTIESIDISSLTMGYLIFKLKEASKLIKVHYEKNLDFWGDIPILI